ncbi:hemerythrin domain-containing protein [Sphingomonas colocasiae]|jgi:hemerythrin-like domain-containing protein|uniref:Hemerythrin domain-containing protein n=1 Tax=Sphingomonas colocasiae TaxID=1848973 RepID=A0ABS7PXJ1_9SPHN|nr:hemerythrin domain-containing protein [Sphingomonas colocasiae]MBY8826011.1 hemerythrin domain-containing protein [Sphingomonas colocasiae]
MATPEIFERLKQDHDRHRTMLARIDETKGDSAERRALFEAFRVEVTAHAAAEEESLYATMLAKPDLREDAQHSVSEHKEIDDFLEELDEMEFSSPGWLTRFRAMRDRYEHHIDEEEEEMFPDAAKELTDAEEARLAEVFKRRKPAELERAK